MSLDSPDSDDFFDARENTSSERTSPSPPVGDKKLTAPVPKIAFLPATPVLTSPVKSRKPEEPMSRRHKLDSLRLRMGDEYEMSDQSVSENASLSSWGRHLLLSNENIPEGGATTVSAHDTNSTKATSPENLIPALPPPPKAATLAVDDSKSTSSYSTNSSKSNTLDRYDTPSDGTEVARSKSNSLDRGLSLRLRSCYSSTPSSKTNSLTRELSVSMAESFMSVEQEQEQRRKDSQAVQVIDELTSELSKEVCLSEPSTSRSIDSNKLETVPEQTSPEPVSGPEDSPERRVENGHKQPDIVSSHTFKAPDSPKPPPRRRRKSDKENPKIDVRGASPAVEEARRSVSLDDVLREVTVTNLDTGEQVSLDKAEEKICSIDPISYQVLKRKLSMHKHLYPDTLSIADTALSDRSSVSSFDVDTQSLSSNTGTIRGAKSKALLFKRVVGKGVHKVMHRAMSKAKHAAVEAASKLHGEESPFPTDEEDEENQESAGLVRAKHQKKGPFDFDQLRKVQDLSGEHSGAVWCLKFSSCGRLLATAGQDNVIRVWVLRDHYEYFNMMRDKYNLEAKRANTSGNVSDALIQISADAVNIEQSLEGVESHHLSLGAEFNEDIWAPFVPKPFCSYRGHTADVLDLSWSKNYFVLSSSMDRTVRLWHISRNECLCVFQHIDFVTCIAFLPKDDRYFLSGSLDAKLRLWHIPDKKVALWNEVDGGRLVTALTFVKNGKFAVVGTFDGRCIFYSTEHLKYHTVIDVRSTRGKNARGHKITGLAVHGDKLLVTSNDSRVRLYDLRDLSLTCKYKGASNYASQIRASFSPHGKHIVCGSEDRFVYIWRTSLESATLSVRKDRNHMWERVRSHNTVVTSAVFAPKPELMFEQMERAKKRAGADSVPGTPNASERRKDGRAMTGDILVTADFSGAVSVFMNRVRIKTGASQFFPTD